LRRFEIGVLAAALALVVAACGGDTAETTTTAGGDATTTTAGTTETTEATTTTEAGPMASGTLTVGASNALITFDPHASQSGSQLQFIEPVFDKLIRDLPNGELVPGLATSWEWTNDERTELTLEIREGVTFHDGEELTAEVVAANILRARDTAGPRGAGLAGITDAVATGPLTVVVSLEAPAPALPNDFANVVGMMISPSQLEGDDVERAPIGTGPWIYDADNSVVGERYIYNLNPDYWDPSVQGVETIVVLEMPDDDARINALLGGQIDMTVIRPNQVVQAEGAGLTVISSPERWYGLLLSDRNGTVIPELADVRVRQALNFAVDRQAIVDATQFGIGAPTVQIFPPGGMGHNPDIDDYYTYDPDRARELLTEAGVTDLTLPTVTLAPLSAPTEAVGEYLRDIGITLEIEVLEPGTLGAAARSTENPTAFFAYGQPDPSLDVSGVVLENAPYNPFRTVNPEIARLAEEGAAGDTFEERNAAYQQLSAILTEEAWFLPVYFGHVVAAHSDRVHGAAFHLARGFAPVSYLGITVDG
jgi:peptide/nickel transport system substrate-binding protein